MKISVIGATGYAGEELVRILANHPAAEIIHITSESHTGMQFEAVYPHLSRYCDQELISLHDEEKLAQSDVVFLALPHGHAMGVAKKLASMGVKIIDLGADYRFRDTAVYEAWYKVPHTHPEAEAVYGLTELYRERIKTARLVGNPGCFTTAAILALTPLVQRGLVELSSLVVDAKSGVSGAGRSPSLGSHFTEVFENVKAYNIGVHRHTPEIEQALSEFAGEPVVLSFTPHLIPMARGILSTCYASLKAGVQAVDIDEAFAAAYETEYFVRLLGRGGYPLTKNTRGSNFCDIGWHVDSRTNRVVVVSALDNLVKGAAGQAVQNMNVLFDLDERTGLRQAPLYP